MIKNKIGRVAAVLAAVATVALTGAPAASAHPTPDQPNYTQPYTVKYTNNSGLVTVGTSTYRAANIVAPYIAGQPYGQHRATLVHEHYMNPGDGKTIEARTQSYCVENAFGQTTAALLYGGTKHGPAGGSGTFTVRDPQVFTDDLAVEHCRVYQWNSEAIERNAATGVQTARQLVMLQVRTW